MDITIKINTDNEAFTDNISGEVARILRDVANKLETADLTEPYDARLTLLDINGNTCGKVTATA